MCGFSGFLGNWNDVATPDAVLRRMTDAIAHRGPDSDGHWFDEAAGIAMGHRRLAIVDLSPAGAQPMVSASGRWVLIFNGEIYNHLDLRVELGQHQGGLAWRGHSDTETLLACFDRWGIRATVERSIGMFAFSVWDRQARTLTLARDRLGEKPLYYGWQGRGRAAVFLFGSELKALHAHPAFGAQINRDALCLFMRHNNVGGHHSIYEGIHKLLPGSLLSVSQAAPEPAFQTYWSSAAAAQRGMAQRFEGSPTEAVDELEVLLKDAVRRQMMADVPLGAFLSGGVDSSTVVALMQTQASRPVKTFSIGFHEAAYNEAEHAKAVAQHLGTEHTEMYVTPEQALAVIPSLPGLYCEPFADSSQIPTFLVSQLARRHVTVSLSGDAGDELFCGYNRYSLAASLWHRLSAVPQPMRRMVARGLTSVSPGRLDRIAAHTPLGRRWANVGDKLHKGAGVMTASSVAELYRSMVSHWLRPEDVVLGGTEPTTALNDSAPALAGLGDIERMMALDLQTYLPDDILAKVDRAAMGVSLETRVPFLDHRVVEFAWQLPMEYKLSDENKGSTTKWALRQVLFRHVPKALIERPKMGFGVPIADWLRGPLRPWAEDLLSEARLKRDGYFNPAPIRKKWAEHVSGQRNWQQQLWCVLMFQAWLTEQVPVTP
ncbi:asparagine synthase (glutamine-hydrolysing) [Variovorax sp. 54]|uniref:asparagine synthase (glutamine-hydrolyzing) n=1 Tax=Variovorax sp. 54 TaxID=2035212 RepID=UPI000C18036A|nr:asparagine synthase (glutamine-hydrolyzing) [Variovorax sp. 54]PIF76981.1 asparagine synthase (glutamine-hydrolysing) [Variovorax sp. 54]